MTSQILSRLGAGAAVAIATTALCACTATNRTATVHSAGGETGAKAAAFRYLFANNESALQRSASTYCIGTGPAAMPANPTPDLLAALSDVRPAVQPVSACRVGERVVDSANRPALIFNLETTECDVITSCFFRGGYQEGNLSASTAMYHARVVEGRWQVTKAGPAAIS